jgi:hypothetical protein
MIVVNGGDTGDGRRQLLRLIPAVFASVVFHGVLLGLFFLGVMTLGAGAAAPKETVTDATINADPVVEEKKDPLLATDIDPAAQEIDTDIQYMVDRKADVSVPGAVNANEAVGIQDGPMNVAPTNLPAPGGFGNGGQGGAFEVPGIGNSNAVGQVGGYGPRGLPLAGSFYGRSGATREMALRNGGGTTASEAAVGRGLKWIARQQSPDGRWTLQGAYKDRGDTQNDVAATAFGLLPLLAAGKTHKPLVDGKPNPYDKNVERGLSFLIRRQDKKTGSFDGNMYAHGLASIAMCEAYGLTQDPALRRPAQQAVNFIVSAQHPTNGGWRYSPGQEGDTSVTGWQVMALKSAQMAGLDVPEVTMRKAVAYLNMCMAPDKGYGYTGPGSTPTMSAVGLLCRQYLQAWGPQNPNMIDGIKNHITKLKPGSTKNIYFFYYATQVMHHYGGDAWKAWNEPMREFLVKTQDGDNKSPNFGSWNSAGDPHGRAGGRLMVTSLNLLTLEVYYRYLPLYYREAGARKDPAVGG